MSHNRTQRYLRVPVEQTFGMISHFKIVGNTKFRGDLVLQGENFLLCTQLTARMMRLRDSYPRGKKFLEGQKEAWEVALGEGLYVDPDDPEAYMF